MRELIVFARSLFRMLLFVRGVLVGLFLTLLGFAWMTAKFEEIAFLDALYFTLITALTVGYGDITPSTGAARIVGVLSGLVGIIFMGLVVAVSTRALEIAVEEERQLRQSKLRGDGPPR